MLAINSIAKGVHRLTKLAPFLHLFVDMGEFKEVQVYRDI